MKRFKLLKEQRQSSREPKPKLSLRPWRAKKRARILEQIIVPSDDFDGSSASTNSGSSSSSSNYESASSKNLSSRPGFSLPLMTSNFRHFNARLKPVKEFRRIAKAYLNRIGVVFVFQARAIRLLTWRKASHTLSFLAIYSFICLYPFLLVAVPSAVLLFFIMVPAYLARHPPPPDPILTNPQYALGGPPLAPARVIKPASEMSTDFFRNMRDLQNMMGDFSTAHDLIIDTFTPFTNFAKERLSSAVFLLLTCSSFVLYVVAPLLPLRHICLVAGWGIIALLHPAVQGPAKATAEKHGKPWVVLLAERFDAWVSSDITLDEPSEILEVETFELQRRRLPLELMNSLQTPNESSNILTSTSGSSSNDPNSTSHSLSERETASTSSGGAGEWEGWLFSPSAWEPQAPARIAGERPKGTRFFEDVRPPDGWQWSSKKWILDLGSQEWVESRMLGGLEVEVEGERWVYDLVGGTSNTTAGSGRSRFGRKQAPPANKASSIKKVEEEQQVSRNGSAVSRSEDGSAGGSSFETAAEENVPMRGEWRRRRWVRSVRRARVDGEVARVLSDSTQD